MSPHVPHIIIEAHYSVNIACLVTHRTIGTLMKNVQKWSEGTPLWTAAILKRRPFWKIRRIYILANTSGYICTKFHEVLWKFENFVLWKVKRSILGHFSTFFKMAAKRFHSHLIFFHNFVVLISVYQHTKFHQIWLCSFWDISVQSWSGGTPLWTAAILKWRPFWKFWKSYYKLHTLI